MSNDKTTTAPLVLLGALFPANHAQALWPTMQEQAPNLCAWLAHSQGQVVPVDSLEQRCTATESYLLQTMGFTPAPRPHDRTQQPNMGSGMALILALQAGFWQQLNKKEPVWLAELVHIAPGREGASLIPARLLDIDEPSAQALLESLQPYIGDTPFEFTALSPSHWQVRLRASTTPAAPTQSAAAQPQSTTQAPSTTDKHKQTATAQDEPSLSCTLPIPMATPELVFQTTVQDWWDTSTAGRAWRQWANEIQMLWHQHPVNLQRQQQGQPPINALWLMGGAAAEQLKHPQQELPQVRYDLERAYREQDWNAWLTTLAQLDQQLFAQPPKQLILAGQSGYLVTTAPTTPSWLRRLFSAKKTGQSCWLDPY